MSFQPKLQDFKKVFRFFIDEYGYSLVYEDDPHFMGCMYLRYEKDGAPTIRIETEKFIIDEQIKIQVFASRKNFKRFGRIPNKKTFLSYRAKTPNCITTRI